jgi:predicted S18 family serine protease
MKNRIVMIVLIASLAANIVFLSFLVTPVIPGQVVPVTGHGNLAAGANLSCQNCADLLAYYQSRLNTPCSGENGTIPASRTFAALQAPAVMTTVRYVQRGPFILQQTSGNGTMMNVSVEILPGQGRVLVQTKPLMGVVFQDAANTAVRVAQNRTGTNLSQNDVIFSIEAADQIPEVDGPSAGGLMTVLVEAAIERKVPRQDVTLTGTIDPDGHIRAIGGIVEKAQAAKETGKVLFLIPEENNRLQLVVQNTRNVGGVNIMEKAPQTFSTKEYIEQNVGISVQYISSIQDVEQVVLG